MKNNEKFSPNNGNLQETVTLWTGQWRSAGTAGNLSAGAHIGPYTLVRQIGEGGMGVVYLAEQSQPIRRRVALKIVKPGLDSSAVLARFELERQAMELMDHPNISQVLDAGVAEDNRPYFVMELVPGLPITEFCDKARLNVRSRCELMVTVCRAVQHAHQKGIIHRDIKPSNVLVVDSEHGAVPKVIDFGVAKAIETHDAHLTDFTLDGHAVGTPLHMSPEQAKHANSDIDTRTDVYSLGVLLYELLTGTTPIRKQRLQNMDLDELRMAVRREEPERPSARLRRLKEEVARIALERRTAPRALVQSVRGDLDQIVSKAISRSRDERYATANGLARDIERHLHCQPIEAVTPSTFYRLKRYAQRHKTALGTIIFVSAVMAIAAIYSIWKAREASDALRVAEITKGRLSQQAHEVRTALSAAETAKEGLSELLYVADVRLASAAWQDNDTPRVANLLKRHEPLQGERDLREFSWHYLARLVDMNGYEIDRAEGDVETTRFSPNGELLATGGRDGLIRVYHWPDVSAATTIPSGQGRVHDLSFAPNGRKLVTAGRDGTIRVWALEGGKLRPEGNAIEAHRGPATGVAFADAGTLLVSCGRDGKVLVWDAKLLEDGSQFSRDELLKFSLDAHQDAVQALAVSPDDRTLASASDDATLRVWDLKEERLLETISLDRARVVCVTWSQDGTRLAGGDIYGNVFLRDLHEDAPKRLAQLLDGVESVAFLEGDKWLATGDRGGSIQLWSIGGQEATDRVEGQEGYPRWQADDSRITSLALSPDGKHILSGSRSGRICRWDALPPSGRWTIGGSQRRMYDFAFGQGGAHVTVAGEYGLEQWDLERRVRVATWGEDDAPWRCVALSSDGLTLVAANDRGETLAWQVDSRKEQGRWQSPDSVAWERVVFAPNGRHFAAAAWDRLDAAFVFDLRDPGCSWTIPAKQSKCVGFSPSRGKLAVAWMDDALIYDWRSPANPIRLRGHSNTLSDLAFSTDGRVIATVGHDRKLRLWDADSGAEVHAVVAHRDWVRSVNFAPDSWSLVTAGDDGHVRLWHTETGQSLLELPDEGQVILKAAFSSDGQRIACRTADSRIVVYEGIPRQSTDRP